MNGDGTVTQRVAPLPGMEQGSGLKSATLGNAGEDKTGPTVKVKVPSVIAFIMLDLLLFNYLTGWAAAATFYGAGAFERHADAPDGSMAVIAFISEKAVLPAALLVVKDAVLWLNKLRQAHGWFRS